MRVIGSLTLILAASLTIGCDSSSDSTESSSRLPADAGSYLLADEPAGAMGVIAAREAAENGAPLVLVGRVGGAENPWINGRAAFTVLDASMTVVGEGEDSGEGEMCLGDCCASERVACTALVKVVDGAGRLVPVDSRQLLGLNNFDVVVVKGTAKRDDSGNFVMLASGVYVRH